MINQKLIYCLSSGFVFTSRGDFFPLDIALFTKTESVTKLQKVMGHSSINISLTYLRGLEIPKLSEEDMPTIGK